MEQIVSRRHDDRPKKGVSASFDAVEKIFLRKKEVSVLVAQVQDGAVRLTVSDWCRREVNTDRDWVCSAWRPHEVRLGRRHRCTSRGLICAAGNALIYSCDPTRKAEEESELEGKRLARESGSTGVQFGFMSRLRVSYRKATETETTRKSSDVNIHLQN